VAATADRRIILNADDYGFTAGVSAGILECVAAGAVTSVSVMVNTPGFEEGMPRLRALAAPPSVGLHLNLTAGAPLAGAAAVPSLVGADGRFLALAHLAARALLGSVRAADVRREAEAQLGRLRAAWPAVDHLDGHQHVHALPGLCAPVLEAARAAGIEHVRAPLEPAGRHRGALKRIVIALAWRAAAPRGERAPLAVAGIGLAGGPGFLEDLLGVLDRVGPGVTEVLVHPGRAEPELARWDSYLAERDAELEALCSPRLRERLGRGDLRLTDFRAA
jgi:predicted glycoside hydrolase/deacetylase ChbG (UPF0249 family)